MYGKNEVTSNFQRSDGSLLVNDTWATLQGEGPDAGKPATFVRLARCNLRCFFCDTEFETGDWNTPDALLERILSANPKTKLVVITGGEPFLQNFLPLINLLNDQQIDVSIETAGTEYIEGMESYFNTFNRDNMIICSPKTPKLNPDIIPYIDAFKYIVRDGECDEKDGLPIFSTQREGASARLYRPDKGVIYLQPCDENDPIKNIENTKYAARMCMLHGHRLSIQLHKIAQLP